MKHFPWGKLALAVATAISAQTGAAAVLYQQNFDTDTTSLTETLSIYRFSNGGISNAVVQSSQALLTPPGSQSSLDFGTFMGNVVVSFDTTIQGSPGQINVGLRVGDNNYIFHPGYPSGAFRIDGPGGHSNVDIGFTPSLSLIGMSVAINATSRMTTIRIVDGINTYEESFFDANYAAGSSVFGLTTGGNFIGIFDNLLVTDGQVIPEPETYALIVFGLAAVRAAIRRRKA